MSFILSSDIHLDLNPENEYRWELLPWLTKQCDSYGIKWVGILGDLTTAKDKHNAILVNRFVQQLEHLAKYTQVFLLKGNHDYITPECPFFGFVQQIPNVTFITEPCFYGSLTEDICAFLPATKQPEIDWDGLDFNSCSYIFTHQTYKGVVTEGGYPLSGVDPAIFGGTNAKIWSGDIHMPIKLDGTNIEYVGAPYRTNYGDTFIPRIVRIDDSGSARNLYFPCPSKHLLTISDLQDLQRLNVEIKRGDFIKVRCRLRRGDLPEWPKIKQEISQFIIDKGWVLHGQPELTQLVANRPRLKTVADTSYRTPKRLVQDFGREQNLSEELINIGLKLLEESL